MGKITPIDIKSKSEVIIKKGERISARHIRKIESAKIKHLDYDQNNLESMVLAKDIVDKTTGEIALSCNTLIDEEVLSTILHCQCHCDCWYISNRCGYWWGRSKHRCRF